MLGSKPAEIPFRERAINLRYQHSEDQSPIESRKEKTTREKAQNRSRARMSSSMRFDPQSD